LCDENRCSRGPTTPINGGAHHRDASPVGDSALLRSAVALIVSVVRLASDAGHGGLLVIRVVVFVELVVRRDSLLIACSGSWK
jgi:hypothetical protein